MIRGLNQSGHRLRAALNLPWICAWLSRLLLGVAAIEVVTMPLTQHIWTWDRFLQGGQDFELGLLMIVMCLCFVLLRAQHCRQSLSLLLAIGSFRLLTFRWKDWARLILFGETAAASWVGPWSAGHCSYAATEPAALRTLPLLI